jgi:hypothetical protein
MEKKNVLSLREIMMNRKYPREMPEGYAEVGDIIYGKEDEKERPPAVGVPMRVKGMDEHRSLGHDYDTISVELLEDTVSAWSRTPLKSGFRGRWYWWRMYPTYSTDSICHKCIHDCRQRDIKECGFFEENILE